MVKAQATITLSRVNDGSPGVPGRTYFLEPSTLVLKKGQDNVISPGVVDFKAFYRDGNSASRTAYAGRFKIEETTDGSTWKTIYTSSANESSVKHSTYDYLTDAAGNAIITASGHGIVAAVRDIHMIRCTLYAAGGITNALDAQSVTVVDDVDNLKPEDIFNLFTENGKIQGFYKENGQIYVNSTYIKSGTFVAGGVNNKNGKIEVRDSSNQVIGIWDKDGIYVEKGMITSKNESNNSEVRVNGGRVGVFSKNKNIGYIGVNYQLNTDYCGLVFDLETDGDYMMWARKDSINDDTYNTVFGYAKRAGIMNALEESVLCYRNFDLFDNEIKRAYIRNARIRESFNIPNNVQCDIYSDVDFHKWKIKNAHFEEIVGINGLATYTGKFYANTATTPQYGATVFVQNGLITSVMKGFL